jgi:hypothetical protein
MLKVEILIVGRNSSIAEKHVIPLDWEANPSSPQKRDDEILTGFLYPEFGRTASRLGWT